MAAGSIVIDLLLKSGSFETDTDRAGKKLKQFQKDAEAVGKAIGLGLVAAATGFTALFKAQAEAIDAFNDLKDATGASIENISALDDIARRTGSTFDTVASSLVKFNSALNSKSDSDAAGVFKSIGLELEALKKLDPAEAMRQTAVALSKFADDGNKARAVQELFGKSIREAAPLLNDLAEKGELVAKVTTEQALEVEKFNKSLYELKANSTDFARGIVNDVVPALNAWAQNLKLVGGFSGALAARLGTDEIGKLQKQSRELADESKKVAADIKRTTDALGRNPGNNYLEAYIDKQRQRLKELSDASIDASDKIKALIAGTEAKIPKSPAQDEAAKPSVKIPDEKPKKVPVTEAQRYLEMLQKQGEATLNLTSYEKALNDVQKGRLDGLTPALKEQILAQAKLNDVVKQAYDARTSQIEVETRIAKTQLDSIESITESNKKLSEEIALMGLDEVAILQVEKARTSSLRAIKEEEVAKRELAGVAETQLQALNAEIAALRERETLLGRKIDKTVPTIGEGFAKKSGEQIRDTLGDSIEQGILEGFRRGESFSDIFIRELKAQFARTVLRPLIQPIADQGNNAIKDILGSINKLFARDVPGNDVGLAYGPPPGRAIGGPVSASTQYMVGERGPELFVPRSAGTIVPNHALGGGRGIVINNNFASMADVETKQRDDGTTEITFAQKVAEMAHNMVAADVGSGTGKVSRSMKSRGLNLNGGLPRRA